MRWGIRYTRRNERWNMCRRFIMLTFDELEGVVKELYFYSPLTKKPEWPARRVDAFPRLEVPVIIPETEGVCAKSLRWGYPVSWSKNVIFNTRIEKACADSRNMWHESIEQRRCIVPTFGFYESHHSETYRSPKTGKPISQQYLFSSPDSSLLYMAGIFEDDHFSVITTQANTQVSPIHDRMPLLLPSHELRTWVEQGPSGIDTSCISIDLQSRKAE